MAEFRSEISSGAYMSIASANITVHSKLTWPVIGVSFVMYQNNGEIIYEDKQYSTYLELMPLSVIIDYQGIPIASGSSIYGGYIQPNGNTLEIKVPLCERALSFTEEKRIDDIHLLIHINFAYRELISQSPKQNNLLSAVGSLSFPIDYSERKWIKLLSDLGYSDKWIIELDRPKLEGFHEVLEHLEKAKDALYNKKEPEDVIRDLRAARDSFKIYYDAKKAEINEMIDKGSKGEGGQDPKSERIEKLFKSLSNFYNIGPHNDKYKVTYQDALLAYRSFVSLLSYLFSIMVNVEEQN